MITLEKIDQFLEFIETFLDEEKKTELIEIRKKIARSEKWKPIKNCPDYYISSRGRVKSTKGDRPIFLKPGLSRGYLTVNLSDGVFKSHDIHRLVAEHFIPNPENKPCVNHNDGNKLNNYEENLEWVTYSENTQHAFLADLQKPNIKKGEKHGMAKLKEDQVRKIRELYKQGDISQRKLASKFNVSQGTITSIINKKLWKEVK